MALQNADRVWESTTTSGTGAVSLAGALTGYRAFSTVCSDADTCYYCLADQSGTGTGAWEVGLGTYTVSGNTLTRTTILASSNAGSAVSFSTNAKDVFMTVPAVIGLLATGVTMTGLMTLAASGMAFNDGSTQTTSAQAASSLFLQKAGIV